MNRAFDGPADQLTCTTNMLFSYYLPLLSRLDEVCIVSAARQGWFRDGWTVAE